MSRNRRSYSPWMLTLFPFLMWWHRVDGQSLRADLLAGLTGAVVVLPQGVAFATIAGMPPEYGLYAGMVPAIIAALYGSSWHLVSGPTTAASIVLFSAISAYAEPGSIDYVRLVLTLTFMVGVIQLTMGLARLGTLVNFISHSVVIGFTAGAAILIIAAQIKNFFGLEMERGLRFYEVLLSMVSQLDKINWFVTTVALATLLSGIAARRWWRKFPYMIVAMTVGTGLSILFNGIYGQSYTGISTVGALPEQLPPLSSPEFSLEVIRELAPVAFAVTLFALTEAVSIARSIAVKSGQQINGNQEFIGQGMSNIFGGFFSGYVATGSFNRSGLNYEAGAKTPLSAVFAAVMLMGIVLLVAPYVTYLPNAAMAGILFLVGWTLIDFHHIKRVLKASRSEGGILVATFVATLFLELEFAIFLGVLLSLIAYLNRTSRPRILSRMPDPRLPHRAFNTDPELQECPQLKIVRIDGSLFFGAVAHCRDTFARFSEMHPEQKHVLVVCSGIHFVDVAGAEFLVEEANRHRREGGGMYLYDVKDAVCSCFKQGGYGQEIGQENIFRSKQEALNVITSQRLDREICRRCPHRVFKECATLAGEKESDSSSS
ncbi:MAG: SulP family inorganic anion transporter [Gammaproteobacteria bacterium]|nr:SulP family inorganic anion transporter [Gammaproteobacteria bacterium]